MLSNIMTLVIDNPDILSRVCGPNDCNLKQLAILFKSRVLTRGNEILLESQDHKEQKLFREMMDHIIHYSRQDMLPGLGYIHSLYQSLCNENGIGPEEWGSYTLSIPGSNRKVHPSNPLQIQYLKEMESKDLVFSLGPAGTGKTYLAVAAALKALLERKKRKIILTRPVVEAGENLGFLPGDLTQKLTPYLRPLYDAMEDFLTPDVLQRLHENDSIELAPLAYMRGRSLKDCFILLDEAQNTTPEQMKMFLTRLGENSQAVVTGDITQVDLPGRKESGLVHAERVLSNIDDIGFIRFTGDQVIRSALVRQIIGAYEQEN